MPAPKALARRIRARIKEGGFGSIAEYLRHAVRLDLERAEQEKLERLLVEGLASGKPIDATPEWIAQRKAELLAIATQESRNEPER